MAGDIFFLQHYLSSTTGAVQYVIEFLASRVHDASTKALLTDMVEANVALLNLKHPKRAQLVDIIADHLPSHVANLEDTKLRENLSTVFDDLYRLAREQQNYNRDPTPNTYFMIGPDPSKYFKFEIL